MASSFDPARNSGFISDTFMFNAYDPLLYIDPDTNKPAPNVATDWQSEDGGERWIFELRDDITFHSGNSLTAEDVAYSMERYVNVGTANTGQWRDVVDSAEVIDDQTVAFNLNFPYGPFVSSLVRLYIIDKQLAKEHQKSGDHGEHGDYTQDWLHRNEAGSGGYTLEEFQAENRTVMTKFNDYWRDWESNAFDEQVHIQMKESSTFKQAMQREEVLISDTFRPQSTWDELDSYDNVHVERKPSATLYHLPFNCSKAPTDDIHVRRALNYAYDYETALKELFKASMDSQMAGYVPPVMPGRNTDLEPRQQNMDKAQEELDKAEYSIDEINNQLRIWHNTGGVIQENTALLLQDNLRELGIEAEMFNTPFSNLYDWAPSAEDVPNISTVFHGATKPSPEDFTYNKFHPDAPAGLQSMYHYSDPELSEILGEARRTPDTEKRFELFREGQKLAWDGFPSIPIIYNPYNQALNNNVKGWMWYGLSAFQMRANDMYWDA